MKPIRRYAAIAAVIGAVVVFGAAPAFAMAPGSGGSSGPSSAPTVVRTVVVGGTPGWLIALIAIGSALVAAAAAVLADRARARRHLTATPA
jgi:putative copper export protein